MATGDIVLVSDVAVQNTSSGSPASFAALFANAFYGVFIRLNNNASTVSTVVDSTGLNTYVPAKDFSGNVVRIAVAGDLTSEIEFWYCPNSVGHPTSITVTSSNGADQYDILMVGLANADSSRPIDNTGTANPSAGTTILGPNTVTGAQGMVLAVCYTSGTTNSINNGPFSSVIGASNFSLGKVLSQVGGSSGGYQSSWGPGSSHDGMCFAVAIKADPPPCSYSRSLTIDHTQCGSSDSALFPCLVSLSGTYLKTVANGGKVQNTTTINGYTVPCDLLFSSDAVGQSLYPWEIDFYDPVNGILAAWVQIPNVSHSSDTVFYMTYGNAAISTFQGGVAGSVWISNYSGVFHFKDGTTLSVLDSTSNANNGTNHSGTATTGQIDGGVALSGSSQYVTMGNVMNPGAASFMWSAWIKPPNSNQYGHIMSKRDNSTFNQADFVVGSFSAGTPAASKQLGMLLYDGSVVESYYTTGNVADGNWHYVVLIRPLGSAPLIYVDGVSVGLTPDVPYTTDLTITNSANFNFGYDNGTTYFTGSIDEGRVGISRSADWILTEYNNQKTSSTFLTLGSEIFIFPVVGWQSTMNQPQPPDTIEIVGY